MQRNIYMVSLVVNSPVSRTPSSKKVLAESKSQRLPNSFKNSRMNNAAPRPSPLLKPCPSTQLH